MTRSTLAAFVALVSVTMLLCLTGCGGPKKPDGFPPLYPCEVIITKNGVPLEGASVQFNSSDARWPPAGTTDAQGVAVINTLSHPGAPEGEYKVLVSKYELPPPIADGASGGSGDAPSAKLLLHQKFRSPETTPHSCTVTKGGPNRFEFSVE